MTDEEIIRALDEYASRERYEHNGIILSAYRLVQIMLDVDAILHGRNPRKLLDSMNPSGVSNPVNPARGKRFRIIHKSPSQRVPRMSVMDYLGATSGRLSFSARPIAGTQEMPLDWIIEIEEVPKDTPVSLNRKLSR